MLQYSSMFSAGYNHCFGPYMQRQARFISASQFTELRFSLRLITSVWVCVFVGDLILRIILIYDVSASTVLIISPILIGTLTVFTMIWTFRYGHRVRLRASAQLNQVRGPKDS